LETVTCKSCKEEIGKDEKVYPKSGFPNKQSSLISNLVRIVITFGILGFFFGEYLLKETLNNRD